ncbi:FmdB family transcriptional regulator [Rhodoblastus sphagnicola]|uniref:FmdB family transcriptional regulator n=1 Tax=Rhodoblastus sphagnicola TaxID=333368 RepID=A0A2S6MZX2_9HYPH|nr:zinc ribbon domain-containing protein [Rhodoblastus sphagnicola]MBB4197936.1 putative FmdB family regulatory protein [Rhodoblastus sphagnicola]PPQ27923.1 FmdB family transcriptional regulator [Rhodoblastus sphagnicola]
MPLYSFHCSACAADSELLIRSDEPAICPACGSEKMERLPSWLAPDPKFDKMRKAGRARAAREGDLSNFSKKEISTFKK